MADIPANKPPRRPRYSGKNPRRFSEKYKEHQPERYPADVAKVIAGGRTPAGTHRPIMVAEVMAALSPKPGDIAVDCTLGYGGHAERLLEAVLPGGKLLAMDVDPIELPRTEARLRSKPVPPESLTVRRMNFAGQATWVAAESPGGADVLLADLGLSSMQLDDPSRGFTYKADGPLDMRMNPSRGQVASQYLSSVDSAALAAVLAENADVPAAEAMADAILAAHGQRPLLTTRALADVVLSVVKRFPRAYRETGPGAVRLVFQAIRIAVNDEFAALEAFLRQLPLCLKPGGRAAILTFHSGEDRRVKAAFRHGMDTGLYEPAPLDVIRASDAERRDNPRASSAKLRIVTRIPSPLP